MDVSAEPIHDLESLVGHDQPLRWGLDQLSDQLAVTLGCMSPLVPHEGLGPHDDREEALQETVRLKLAAHPGQLVGLNTAEKACGRVLDIDRTGNLSIDEQGL